MRDELEGGCYSCLGIVTVGVCTMPDEDEWSDVSVDVEARYEGPGGT